MTKELKPVRCGCGGEAKASYASIDFLGRNARYSLRCENCGIMTNWFHTEAEAIEAWNKAMGADKRSDLAITKGYWMATYDGLHCSICNYKLDTTAVPDICPRCGSEMKP